jgi:hypothetical protein
LIGSIIGVRGGGVEKEVPTSPPFPIHLKVVKVEGEYRKPLLFFGKNGEVDAITRFALFPLEWHTPPFLPYSDTKEGKNTLLSIPPGLPLTPLHPFYQT